MVHAVESLSVIALLSQELSENHISSGNGKVSETFWTRVLQMKSEV